jgi:hypothetical protein
VCATGTKQEAEDSYELREQQRRELEAEFPGWHIYCLAGKWGAWLDPRISNCASPEELAREIRAAHASPPDGLPALASWRSYRGRVRRLRE